LKDEGNKAYTSKPPNYNIAIEKYQASLKHLPPIPKPEESKEPDSQTGSARSAPITGSGIQEITDEEAEALQSGGSEDKRSPEEIEREEVDDQIRELGKACHGNMAACWAALKEDKRVVEACNQGQYCLPLGPPMNHTGAVGADRKQRSRLILGTQKHCIDGQQQMTGSDHGRL
jgi:hypothetical protein